MTKVLGIAEAVAMTCMTIASGLFVWMTLNGGMPPAATQRPPAIENIEERKLEMVIAAEPMGQGSAGTVALIEFSDFQCPFCGRFGVETFPDLKKDFIETGKIVYSFRHFPLEQVHPEAVTCCYHRGVCTAARPVLGNARVVVCESTKSRDDRGG